MAQNITINIGSVTNNGAPCHDPQILVFGADGVAFPCGKQVDKNGDIKISVPDGAFVGRCITGVIKCSECDSCPPRDFSACLCDTSDDCPSCSQCISGICTSVCAEDETCRDNKCCQCSVDTECKNNFKCDGCKCVCRGFIDASGYCVECLGDQNCSNCESCNNGNCIPKECPNNLICLGSECGCVPGTKYDIVSDSCIPIGCENDGQCDGPCSICVNNQCQEIVCPENYKCVDGTCIFWPCSDEPCADGSTCSESCGCYKGVCTPCYLLECTGECQEALGCKCNNNKCEPVDNCGEYCDGSTPCLGANCTCVNNVCVSCANFDCPTNCNQHYNCACNDAGDCEGGKACTDDLKLTKKQDCSIPNGCELLAEFETATACGCDPIEFRIKNTQVCNKQGQLVGTVMNLQVAAFKNNIAYADYLNQLSIGDDELVNATLKTTITFQKLNNAGVWVNEVVANTLPVSDVIVAGNQNANVVLSLQNFGLNNAGDLIPRRDSRRANIEVRIVDVEIPNNGCVLYGDKVLANYTLDLQTVGLCSQLSSYTAEKSVKLNDNESQRKPLFIWSKSNTNVFAGTKFKTDGTYAQSGWFRKEYGIKIGTKWTDKLNDTKAQAQNQYNELLANYNYQVKVDCGCKSNVAIEQKLLFCCPQNYEATFTACNKKLEIQPFNVCAVNGAVKGTYGVETDTYKVPVQSQTYYFVRIEREGGVTIDRPIDFAARTKTAKFTYNEPNEPSIVSAKVYQSYVAGGLLSTVECLTDLVVPAKDVPTPTVTIECNKNLTQDQGDNRTATWVTITQPSGAIKFNKVEFYRSIDGVVNANMAPFNNGLNNTTGNFASVPSYFQALPNSKITAGMTVVARVYFTNGCSIDLPLEKCPSKLVATPEPDAYAKASCPLGGSNPNIVVTEASGFTDAAQYSIDGVNYQASKTFSNKPAGTYTIFAKETIEGTEYTATTTVTILEPVVPTLTFSNNLCGGQTAIVSITGAVGSTFAFSTPAGVVAPGFITIPAGGVYNFTAPTNGAGVYTATLTSDSTGSSCIPSTVSGTLTADGATLVPTITLDGTVCVGSPLNFRINDGGANQTYFISASGGTLSTASLQATQGGFNGVFTPNTVSGLISITGSTNSCNTVTPYSITVTSTDGPMITAGSAICSSSSETITATVTVTGTPTLVTINGVTATNLGGGTYQVTGISKLLETVTAIASNATCSDSLVIDIPNCNCDPGTITIGSDSPTCGEGNTSVYPVSYNAGYLVGSTWQWYEVIGGIDTVIGGASGTIQPMVDVAPLAVTSTIQQKSYKLVITKPNGCPYASNTVSVVAGSNIMATINGLDTINSGVTTTYAGGPVISGATYEWRLSNGAVSNQLVGTSSNLTITFSEPGANTLVLTVISGICTDSETLVVNVTANCVQTIILNAPTTTCGNITATVSVGASGSTIVSHRWLENGITVLQSGGAIIQPLDTSVLVNGTTYNVSLEVVFSNSCTIESDIYTYTRGETPIIETLTVVTTTKDAWGMDGTLFFGGATVLPITAATVGIQAPLDVAPWDYPFVIGVPQPDARMNKSAINNAENVITGKIITTAAGSSIGFGFDNFGQVWINNVLVYDITSPQNNSTAFKKWRVIDRSILIGDCIVFKANSVSGVFGAGIEIYNQNIATLQTYVNAGQVNAAVVESTRTATIDWYRCPTLPLDFTTPCTPECNCL